MRQMIQAEGDRTLLAVLNQDVPGRVYTLSRRRMDEKMNPFYEEGQMTFSLYRAVEQCQNCQPEEGEPYIHFRLELTDPEPDGGAGFVGMFFLRQYPGERPVLHDAILGRKTWLALGKPDPADQRLDRRQRELYDARPVLKEQEESILRQLREYLPFEKFSCPAFEFDAGDYCRLVSGINAYLLEVGPLFPRRALTILMGVTQIASASIGDSLILETAKLAAGTLLRNYRNGTLEHGRLVFLAGVSGLRGQQEFYRERYALELPDGDLDEFSRCLVLFAATGELMELDYRAGRPVYRFLPLEKFCGEEYVDQSFLWE